MSPDIEAHADIGPAGFSLGGSFRPTGTIFKTVKPCSTAVIYVKEVFKKPLITAVHTDDGGNTTISERRLGEK